MNEFVKFIDIMVWLICTSTLKKNLVEKIAEPSFPEDDRKILL